MTKGNKTTDWNVLFGALTRQFPNSNPDDLRALTAQREEITRVLAQDHDLTVNEVREELQDLMFVASLARTTADFRIYDKEALNVADAVSRVTS